MEGVSNWRTPTLDSKQQSRVIVLVYRDTIHSLGGATETGVAKVTIFMDVLPLVSLEQGHAKDQTGMEMGGGGGIEGDAKATKLRLRKDADDMAG